MIWLQKILVVVQVLSALAMIGLILVQHGKGADMGAAFGSGSSGSLFGASGGANFLSRSTAVLAAIFFTCTLGLAFWGMCAPLARVLCWTKWFSRRHQASPQRVRRPVRLCLMHLLAQRLSVPVQVVHL